MNPEVSVIIIVRNGEAHLGRCLDSVLAQTHTNLELIVVNDGSTDGTRAVIDRHQAIDRRLSAIHLEINQGRASARNTGLKKASGEYIIFVDADDRLPRSSIEEQLKTAQKWNADIVFGRTECFDVDSGLPVDGHYTSQIIDREQHNITLHENVSLVHNHQVVGRLINRRFLSQNNIWFSHQRRNGEDVLFSFYAVFHAHNISLIPEVTVYHYYIGNYLQSPTESKLLDARDNILETMRFSMQKGDEKLIGEMAKKAAVFSASLARAAVVYAGKPELFERYIESLIPLAEHVDEATLKSLTPYQRKFVRALQRNDYAGAALIWNQRRSRNAASAAPKKTEIDIGDLDRNQQAMETELQALKAGTEERATHIDALHNSMSWRMTRPLRKVQKVFARRTGLKVSVIVPVYNTEKYLSKCLDSVLGQTLRDFELICVNDCSPDNCARVVEEYRSKDQRIVSIDHVSNKGLAGARNTGIEAARGRYIFFLDSDDFLACDDAFETLYDTAIDDDADEVIGGVVKWYEATGLANLGWHADYLEKEVHAKNLRQLPQLIANVVAWNKLIRRSFLDKHKLRFNEKIRKHEDNPFSVQLHVLARKISIVPRTTYVYRQDREGSMLATIQKSDIESRLAYSHDIFKFLQSKTEYSKYRKLFYPYYARQLIANARLLSRFSPDANERAELVKSWKPIIELLGGDYSSLRPRQRKIFKLVLQGEYSEAWDRAILFSKLADKKNKAEQAAKNKAVAEPKYGFAASPASALNPALHARIMQAQAAHDRLKRRIHHVKASLSWRLTAPLRNVVKRGPG